MQNAKRRTKIKYSKYLIAFFLFTLCALRLYAMDVDLLNAPLPQGAELVYKDMSVEINEVHARATHLTSSQLMPKEIIDFYKDVFIRQGWQIKDYFEQQNIIAFIKGDRFFYVGIQDNGKDFPCDIYLISSPADLALCRMLKDYFLKPEIAPDVSGKDPDDIPRYPGAKRRLNIAAPAQGDILCYEAEGSISDIAKFYDSQLSLSGWQRIQAFELGKIKSVTPEAENIDILLFEKDQNSLIINIYSMPMEGGKRTLITITKNIAEIISPLKKD